MKTNKSIAVLFENLPIRDQTIITRFYEGFTLKQVSEEVGYNYSALRAIMCKSGRLYPYYKQYKEIRDSERIEQVGKIRQNLEESAHGAIMTIREVMMNNNPSNTHNDTNRLKAAEMVLSRIIPSEAKLEVSGDIHITNEIPDISKLSDRELDQFDTLVQKLTTTKAADSKGEEET